MKDFFLSAEQVNELRAAHRAERYSQAAYKVNAVILLGTGWKLKEVKEALLLDAETLRVYVDRYQTGGIAALRETHYLGRIAHLDEGQRESGVKSWMKISISPPAPSSTMSSASLM